MWLAIDTSTRRTVLALYDEESECVLVERIFEPRATQRVIFSELARILEGGSLQKISAIAAGIGPGSFTGVKIGVIAAKTLAWSRRIPLVGVGSLNAVAAGTALPRNPETGLVVAVPSTRGEGYVQLYEAGKEKWTPVGPTHDVPLEAERLRTFLPPGPVLISGEAAESFARALTWKDDAVLADEDSRFPSAAGLLRLAVNRLKIGGIDDPLKLVPCYIRPTQPERLESGGSVDA